MSDLIERAEKCAAEYAEKRDAASPGPWRTEWYGDMAGIWFVEKGPENDKSDCFDVFEDPKESDCDLAAHARSTNAPEIIRELIEKYKEALNACESALKYDDAIRCRVDEGGNVNFNKEGEAFMEGSGTNLDALYEEWMSKADKVVSFSQKKESERKPLY